MTPHKAAAGILCALVFTLMMPAAYATESVVPQQCNNDGRCNSFDSSTAQFSAKRHRHRNRAPVRTDLVTVNTAAGIKITCHPAFCSKFQSLIATLVSQGHKPRFITCYARGHKAGSNHAWGGACDIDQTGWGRTSAFMYRAGDAIRSAGLYDGCSFRDCGHVEAMRGLYNRPPNLYAAVAKFKADQASR